MVEREGGRGRGKEVVGVEGGDREREWGEERVLMSDMEQQYWRSDSQCRILWCHVGRFRIMIM